MIHAGLVFQHFLKIPIAGNATINIKFSTGSAEVHVLPTEISTRSAIDVDLFEGSTFSGGTETNFNIENKDRNSPNTQIMTVDHYVGGTVTDGQLINQYMIGTTSKSGGTVEGGAETLLKINTDYGIKCVNQDATAGVILVKFTTHEV